MGVELLSDLDLVLTESQQMQMRSSAGNESYR